jgi:hypothetical protein
VAEIVNPAMSSDGWALLLKDDLVTMPHGCKEDSDLAGFCDAGGDHLICAVQRN